MLAQSAPLFPDLPPGVETTLERVSGLGERSTVFCSLIDAAKRHGLDPEAHPTRVLEQIGGN